MQEEWLAEQAALKEQAEAEQLEAQKELEEAVRRGHSLESETGRVAGQLVLPHGVGEKILQDHVVVANGLGRQTALLTIP